MNNTAVISSGGLREKVKTERKQSALLEKLKKSGSLILIAAMFVIGSAVALFFNIPIKSVYQLDCRDRHHAAFSYQDSRNVQG